MNSKNTSFTKNKIKMCAVLMAMLGILVCTGCNSTTDGKITIVCTNFALYDWTSQLLGESEAEVILLLDNGTDMHSFQPSAEELIQIADCDMLVHVGGESDAWLEDALEVNPKEDRVVVNLMEVLEADLREEVYTEGMQTEHVHEDGSVCLEENDHDEHLAGENDETGNVVPDSHSVVMDEHVWLSLRMAVKSCEAIEDALCQVLPNDAERIRANSEAYCKELVALDQKYVDVVERNATEDLVIVADRFPFIYMMEDYGIEYYAAFPGCSTESEADFETVVFLAEKVQEYNADTLLITESGTDTLANTVFENAKMSGETAMLHSMQVVYNSDVEAGASYLGYMEANLEVLKEVLK
ncbi:MAG: zinc ABC transporter substrate-binding protein [Lachnospiraceae bacterium]|nr:zinc ABC transporter substrate-binding protein [Lachnospiraceae bacterium]